MGRSVGEIIMTVDILITRLGGLIHLGPKMYHAGISISKTASLDFPSVNKPLLGSTETALINGRQIIGV